MAADIYEKIAQKWPSASPVYLRLSDIYDYMGRPSDSITAARKFVELEPKMAMSYLNLGQKQRDNGFFDEAIEPLQKAIVIDPTCGEAYFVLADIYEIAGDRDNMLASLRNAYRYLPRTWPLALKIGVTLAHNGNSAEAIEPLEFANRLRPDFPDVMRSLGLAYIEVARYDEGVAMIERANQISPLPANMTMDVSGVKPPAVPRPF